MPTLAEFMGAGDGFGFEHPEPVDRLRAGVVVDEYSQKPIGEDWSKMTTLPLEGAISSTGQTQADGTQRRQTTVSALLTIADPGADVKIGDRIRRGTDLWSVVEFPEIDMNPFTGWRPTLVVALEEVHG